MGRQICSGCGSITYSPDRLCGKCFDKRPPKSDEVAELQKTVFFFASVIKSGESWGPALEERLEHARGCGKS